MACGLWWSWRSSSQCRLSPQASSLDYFLLDELLTGRNCTSSTNTSIWPTALLQLNRRRLALASFIQQQNSRHHSSACVFYVASTRLEMTSTQFTALIRLPFVRGSFEDPPQVSCFNLRSWAPTDQEGAMGRRERSTAMESHLQIIKD